MKIGYFDLGLSIEQYGLYPTRYGGGAVVARYLKQDPEIDFHVIARKESFDNLTVDDRADRCFPLSLSACLGLFSGSPLDDIEGLDVHSFDLILHPQTCWSFNRGSYKGPIVHFCGFDGKAGHPSNDYILLYDTSFRAQFEEKVKYVRIGKPVPPTFIPSVKQPFVFQCSRHDDHQNTIEVAKACCAAGIPGIFAGPIHHDYPLMRYIDGQNTLYVGEIDEEEKLDYCKRATLFTLLPTWNIPFSQSIIEAQGQGTPIWVNKRGSFLETYLKHTVNGFDASLFTLDQAFRSARTVDMQRECWGAARQYDTSVMVSSFKKAFREIVEEWKVR